ncbi:hypothetical protein TrST_g9196 [Triparma strigata]|uniref:Uncharacterized protein n=1 Tax=Triparma strigata TaxID=1606541 RepID=A0A9W7AWU4_9STRA|nr:hypothetical protein TrST_g9196 [Triparma strigata]
MSNKRTAEDRAKHWDPRIDTAPENQISSSFRCLQAMVNMQIEMTSKNMTMEMDGDGAFAKLRLSFIAKIQWNSVHPTLAPLHKNDSDWKQDPAAFNKYHFPPCPEILKINGVQPNTKERAHLKKLQIDATEQNLVNPSRSVNKKSAMKALKYLLIAYLKKEEANIDDLEMDDFKDFKDEVKRMELTVDRYQLTQKYEFSIPTDFTSNLANYPYDQHTIKLNFMMSSSKVQAYDFDKYGVGEKVHLKWKGKDTVSTRKDEDDSFSDDSSSLTLSSVSSDSHMDLREIVQNEKIFEISEIKTGDDNIKDGSFTVKHCTSKEPLKLDGEEVIVDFKRKKGSNWEVKPEFEYNPDSKNEPKCSQFQILLSELVYESEMQMGLSQVLHNPDQQEGKAASGASSQKRLSLHTKASELSKEIKPEKDCFKKLKKKDSRNVYYRCIPKKYHSQAYNEVNENIAEFDISPFTLKIEEVIDKLPKQKKKEIGGNMVDFNKGDIEMEEDHFVEDNPLARQASISQFADGGKKKRRKINRKQEKYYENSFALSFTLVRLVHNGVFSILFPLWVMLTLEPFVYLFEGDSVNEPYAYLITLLLAITGHRQVMQVKLESFVRTTSADWLFLVTVGSILAQMAILAIYFHGGFNQSEHGHWLLADDVSRRRTAFFLHEGLILILITKSSWSMFKPLRLLRRPTKVSTILHGIKSNESLEEIRNLYEHGNLAGVDYKKYRELIGVKKYILLDKTTSSEDVIFSLFGGNDTLESKIEVKTFLSYNLKMTLSDEIPTDLFRIRCGEKMKKEVQEVFSGSNDMVKKMKDITDTDNEESQNISRVVYGVMFHSQPKAIALEMQFMKGDLKNVNKDLEVLKKGRMKSNYKKFYEQVLEEYGQDKVKRTKKNIKQFSTVRSLVGAAKKIINDYKDWRNIQGLLEAGKPQAQPRNTLTSADIDAGAKL